MSKLDISVPHQLTQEEALTRIKKLLGNLQQEQKDVVSNVKEEWSGNTGKFSFSAKGFDIAGTIQVSDKDVSIEGELPFLVSLFKGKITEIIQDKAGKLLAK